MNRKFKISRITLLLMCLCLVFLFSCGEENEKNEVRVETEIVPTSECETIFSQGINVSSEGERATISFSTNKDWSVSLAETQNGDNWCTVSPSSGKAGNVTLTIVVASNTGYDDRNVVLKLSVDELTKSIMINQKQKDALTLTSNRFEVDKDGGIINLQVKSNIDYNVTVAENSRTWIEPVISERTRGLSTSFYSFAISPSEEYDKREGEIIFQSKDISETVHIYQTGGGILILSPNEYSVSEKGGTIRVEIKSNFNFDVQMPDVDWIEPTTKTRKIATNTIYYTISPNETCDDREAEIIFFNKERPIKYEILKIIQTGIKSVSIHLVDAGTLVNVLGNKINKITSLSLSGTINASDIISIRKMKQLEELNLEDVSIVGGGSYYTHSETYPLENIQYYAKDNTIGGYMFAGLYNLKRITLPKNTISIEPYAF